MLGHRGGGAGSRDRNRDPAGRAPLADGLQSSVGRAVGCHAGPPVRLYKLRADVGRKCRLRYQGSLKSVQARARAALDSLVKKARLDQVPAETYTRKTVVGHRRNELLLGAGARHPAPQSKQLASFRKVTHDRVKAKQAVRLWRGIDKTLPPARPKEGDRLPHVVAAPSSTPRAAAPRLALARPQDKTSARRGLAGCASQG